MRLPKVVAATAALALLATADANAAGKRFCNEYAGTSVEQFNRAQELGLPVSGPRWHGAFDLHKAWCRFVSKDAAQHEMDERRDVISAAEPPADAGAPGALDDVAEPPSSDSAGEPPPSDFAEPPLSAPVSPPGSDGEPGSGLSSGEPPLSAPVTPPSSSPPAEEPPASDAGEPPPSEGGLTWEPAD